MLIDPFKMEDVKFNQHNMVGTLNQFISGLEWAVIVTATVVVIIWKGLFL